MKEFMEAVNQLLAALDAREALRQAIRSAGIPPHTDYWHQSIAEADERIATALASVRLHQL